jgi:polyvinyl alcohol dehydrogenase (cytochrome)
MRTSSHALTTTLLTLIALAPVTQLGNAQNAQGQPNPSLGEQAYQRSCAACHDNGVARSPPRDALAKLSPQRILRTMDFGLMMSAAYPLSRDERNAVAQFLGKGTDAQAITASAMCKPSHKVMSKPSKASWESWSPTLANTRFQSAAGAGLNASQLDKLELKWAFGFPGDVISFAAPTLLNGTMFMGSAGGMVQAVDAGSGCIHWSFTANGPVRTPPTIAKTKSGHSLLLTDQIGGVYALDARTGRAQWQMKVEQHDSTRLTGTITTHNGVAYVPAASWEETRAVDPKYVCCTFRGSLSAVRVTDGKVLWKTFFVDPPQKTGVSSAGTDLYGPSGVGVWAAPTIDAKRGLIYVATGDNYSHPATSLSDAILALDISTGRIMWAQQTLANDVFNAMCPRGVIANCGPDHDFAAPAMLVRTTSGHEVLVAGQKSGVVFGLDPDAKGKVLWQTRVGKGGTAGGVQWGMATDGRNVYAATADAIRTQGDPSSLQIGNAVFDPVLGGGLTALNVLTGEKAWFAPSTPCKRESVGCSPAQPGSVTAIPGAVFSGAMDGHIRAFSTDDGRLLWDFNTQQNFTTVNGVPAAGGSLDGAGAVVVDGMVYVNSGYPRLGGVPGNVMLAFGLRN